MERRRTPNKERILRIFDEHHVLSASEVASYVPDIPFSTVCRNVERFVVDGVLTQVQMPGRPVSYEKVCHPHGHLVCTGCNTVSSFAMQAPLRALLARHHFNSRSMSISGLCNHCI